MRHGSLFSGIGGFDLAAEWMGWENVFHCEWNEFGRKILKHHFPESDSFADTTKTDFKKYEGTIDIISGGFPCQPFSLAGKRKGTEDERYLWHEMLRAIQEIKPKFVIAENVYGIVNIDGGLVFEQVCLDLEAEGYEVQPFIVPACARDAPHRRDRVWIVAYSSSYGGQKNTQRQQSKNEEDKKQPKRSHNSRTSSNTDNVRLQFSEDTREVRRGQAEVCGEGCKSTNASETNGEERTTSNTKRERRLQVNRDGEPRLDNEETSTNWWQSFPAQSPLCRRDDGFSERLDCISFPKWRRESIKAYGNAIVPQVAFEIFKALSGTNC
jgi:DNA (cytosine-5)-methyltransferase 1